MSFGISLAFIASMIAPTTIEPCHGANSSQQVYNIRTTWDNQTIPESNFVQLTFSPSSDKNGFVIDITAPFYNDSKPPSEPGRLNGLWNYEVVEVFFLGQDEKYLELEFGPWGHYLAFYLEGKHKVTKPDLMLPSYNRTIDLETRTWTGTVVIPREYLPPGVDSFNAYAIHGVGERREYLSLFPVPFNSSTSADFHRLDAFQKIDMSSLLM